MDINTLEQLMQLCVKYKVSDLAIDGCHMHINLPSDIQNQPLIVHEQHYALDLFAKDDE